MNITHNEMPTFEEHISFWVNDPYGEAYIIYNTTSVGLIYLTREKEVGIFIDSIYQGHGIGQEAMKILLTKHRGEKITANINPKNTKSITFFTQQGFKPTEIIYELFS